MLSQTSSRRFRLEFEFDVKIKNLSLTSRQVSSFIFKIWLDFFKSSSWYFSSFWLVAINLRKSALKSWHYSSFQSRSFDDDYLEDFREIVFILTRNRRSTLVLFLIFSDFMFCRIHISVFFFSDFSIHLSVRSHCVREFVSHETQIKMLNECLLCRINQRYDEKDETI